MGLHNLEAPKGANKRKKRVGRGPGSGHGKTSTRGHKGQKSRSGYSSMRGFEGGQMPLHRRLPKRGFTNIFKKEWTEINLKMLELLYEANDTVTPDSLVEKGVVSKLAKDGVVILANGELTKPLKVQAHRFSDKAKEKIQAAGGTVEVC
ncbi:MAG TPA: 50S ribosomal protein L15 [Acidobacteriota bacterium]|nr:50S ribosomal protein L15 [Acidobacteriota bacterium]HMZ79570.1 50S ribosomal protein L15 [Acidobacteriota bacterium]HNB69870.1 50S ribosomal protein L15 [Acidobacteriota bacterium]HND19206.1 50S ribosomal protein L15 [Acidobacteriota bacterium]HNJ40265.1 50S ribosomal protein L15 [Acidobacteriota bacterium]